MADRLQDGLSWGMRWDQEWQPNHLPAELVEVLTAQLPPLTPAKNYLGGSMTWVQG